METWSEIFRSRKFWAAIIGSLLVKELITRLSVLTAAGALKLWSRLLSVITLGSTTVRDAPYASAALNPYPVPALMLLTGCVMMLGGLILYISLRAFSRVVRASLRVRRGLPIERRAKGFFIDGRLAKKKFVFLVFGSVYLWTFVAALSIPAGIINEAVLARRFYEADQAMIAPYLSSTQLVQLQADFAQITTKEEYKAFMNRPDVIGQQHQIRMHQVTCNE